MIKFNGIKRGACIGAAVFMLGACGQAQKAEPAPAEAAAESTAAETSAEEKQETAAAKEEDKTAEETKEKAEESLEEDTKEAEKDKEEKDTKEESADAAKDSSEAKEEETSASEETAAQGNIKKVSDIYGEISQAVALQSPMLVPDDFIMNYYGIDVSTLDEYVFSMSEEAISAETVVILKAKDAGSTGALSASLQTVIDQKRSEMENYLPDQFQIVDKSSVQVKGNYVYLVISEQADAINRIIQADIP